jgi:hypothetical protein
MVDRGGEFKAWASILAPVIGAAVLGGAGIVIQARIAGETNAREYVQLAVNILREEPSEGSRPLRQFAVDVLAEKSPVALSQEMKDALLAKKLRVAAGSYGEGFGPGYGLGFSHSTQ